MKLSEALSADYTRSYNDVNFISCCASPKKSQSKSTPTLDYALKTVVKMMYRFVLFHKIFLGQFVNRSSLSIEMQPKVLEKRYGFRKPNSIIGALEDDDGSV